MADDKSHPTVMTDSTENSQSDEKVEDVNVVKKVHADGTVDLIDAHAIGGAVDEMPKGYYYSPQFIGTVTVR
jgi:hypothetical protein